MRDFAHALGLGLASVGALFALFTNVGVVPDALIVSGLVLALVTHEPTTHGVQ